MESHKLNQVNKLIQGSGSSSTFNLVGDGDDPFPDPFARVLHTPRYCSAADESSSPVFSDSFS